MKKGRVNLKRLGTFFKYDFFPHLLASKQFVVVSWNSQEGPTNTIKIFASSMSAV